MFFEYNGSGKIMVCAEVPIKDGMVFINPPQGFAPEDMHKWLVVNGQIVKNENYVEPEVQQTMEERLNAFEQENAYLREALEMLLGGVTDDA